jgi:CrcB protein
MFANLLGCFLIGVVMALALDKHAISNTTRVVLATGFLGAFTTFSALIFDSVHSLESSDAPLALANIGISLVLGLTLTYAGLVAGRSL